MLEFTKALYELFVRQNNTLSQSLLIMKSKRGFMSLLMKRTLMA